MFAISTSWNSKSQLAIREMLSELREAGFENIELSHRFSAEKLEEISNLIDFFNLRVVSVHNYCPVPPKPQLDRDISDYYRMSSLNEAERKKAVEYTKRSIDTAKRFAANVVIIHAGVVELDENYGGKLIDLFNEGKAGSEYYNELKQRFLSIRREKSHLHLDAVTKSLKEVLSYAADSDIKIGLETRYYPEEIPNLEEMRYFLTVFKNEGLYYWHDVGHAEANERLGIAPHLAYLSEFSDRMLGMHIHDIKGMEDHLLPFSGDFDFDKIVLYLSDKLIKVVEVNASAALEDIKNAVNKLTSSHTYSRSIHKEVPSLR